MLPDAANVLVMSCSTPFLNLTKAASSTSSNALLLRSSKLDSCFLDHPKPKIGSVFLVL